MLSEVRWGMRLLDLSVRAKDDRGRVVCLGALGRNARDAASENADDPELAEIRMRLGVLLTPSMALNGKLTWSEASGLAVALLAMIAVAIASRYIPGLPAWTIGIVLFPFIMVLFRFSMRAHLHKQRERVVVGFLLEGRCPACTYPVRGVPATADGCVVCPECSAAWRRERVGETRAVPESVRRYGRRIARPNEAERWLGPPRMALVTTDGRGRAVSVIDPLLRRLDRAVAARIGEGRVRGVRSAMRRAHRRSGLAGGVVMALALPSFIFMLFARRAATGFVDTAISIATFCFMVWMVWHLGRMLYAMIWGEAAIKADRAAQVLLENRVCPGCCAPLDGVQPGKDGLVECGECGAAWAVAGTAPHAAGKA
jgi:uncharacterized Zn finger protein (UPF0148 family)